jgi:uncharacterized integral membrane protein
MADQPSDKRERIRIEEPRRLLLGGLIVLAVLFAVLNLDRVKVDLIVKSSRIPLLFVIVACLALGAAIDRLLMRRSRHRSR